MRLQYDDETLVYMTLSGEQRAYEELVLRYQSAVLASASSVLRSVYLAEDAAPINMYDGRMPAAFNQFAMRLMESFGEDGVLPEIWYGLYAHKCLIASAALFSMGENEKAKKHLDTAFTYFEKWAEIPKGTELPLGAPWLFGSIKAKKGSNLLIMPDGTKEELYENDVFKERPFCDVAGYLKTWGWFDPVKNEPFFSDYIKRAEEYKK